MMVSAALLLLSASTTSSLVISRAAPALRAAVPATIRAPAQPQMMLGSRSIGKAIRSMKLASFPKSFGSRGGIIRGCDGGDGKPPADGATPTPSEPEDSSNPLTALWRGYETFLEEQPLLAKACTSFVGFFTGDVLAQLFIQKNDPFDWARLFRLASFGFLVHGTTSHWFYGMLDGKIPGTSAKVVFTKVFIDQVLWNPIFGIMFFCYLGILELKGIGYVIDKTKNDLFNAVTGSWTVWPLAHTINFRFVPSNQRVLYINTIQIGYNCFLSILGSKSSE